MRFGITGKPGEPVVALLGWDGPRLAEVADQARQDYLAALELALGKPLTEREYKVYEAWVVMLLESTEVSDDDVAF